MKNRILILSLAASSLMLSAQNVWAANNSCGSNCTYTLTPKVDDNGNPVYTTNNYGQQVQAQVLTISGTGSVTEVGGFWGNSSITEITIGEGITSTGTASSDYGIFSYMSNLTTVNLPSTLTNIGAGSFTGNRKLTNINIPDGVEKIGNRAFEGTGLTSITIPDSVTTIGNSAFTHCYGLTNVELSDNLTTIGNWAFYETGITSITIPDSVTSIGSSAFEGSEITELNIPDSVTSIGARAFYDTKLTDVTIPESVISIGNFAFATSTLQNMTIEGDYVSFGSGTADKWTAAYYGVNTGDVISNIFSLYPNGARNLQNLYCSQEMEAECQKLLDDTSKLLGTSSELGIFRKDGNFYRLGNDRYASLEDMMNGRSANKRIYTVEEAEKASKPTGNKFMIRYK